MNFNKVTKTSWILSLPVETKLGFIEKAIEDKDIGMALGIAKIFLDAPLSKGGISSDEITKVMDKAIAKLN